MVLKGYYGDVTVHSPLVPTQSIETRKMQSIGTRKRRALEREKCRALKREKCRALKREKCRALERENADHWNEKGERLHNDSMKFEVITSKYSRF